MASSGLDPVLDIVKSLKSKSIIDKLKSENQLKKKTNLNDNNDNQKKIANESDKSFGVSNLDSKDTLLSSKTYNSLLSTRSDSNVKEDGVSINLECYVRDNELTKNLDKYLKDRKNIEDQLNFKNDLNKNLDQNIFHNVDSEKKVETSAQKDLQINQNMPDQDPNSLISAIKSNNIEPTLENKRKESDDTLYTLSKFYAPEPLASKLPTSMVSIKNKMISSIEPTFSEFIAFEPEKSAVEYKETKLEPVAKKSFNKIPGPVKVIESELDKLIKLEHKTGKIDKSSEKTSLVNKSKLKSRMHFKSKKNQLTLSKSKVQISIGKFIKEDNKLKEDKNKIDVRQNFKIESKDVKEVKIKAAKQEIASVLPKNFYDSKKVKDPLVIIKTIKATKIGKDIKMVKQIKNFKVIKKFKVKPKLNKLEESSSLDLHHSYSSEDSESPKFRSTISKASETDIENKKKK